jgi:hypothetical protein
VDAASDAAGTLLVPARITTLAATLRRIRIGRGAHEVEAEIVDA